VLFHKEQALKDSALAVVEFWRSAELYPNKEIYKTGRQCTYNVTMRRVHETTVTAVEKQYVLYIGLCLHACACVSACGYRSAWACAYVHIA
jgi:hypothetical protein